LKINILYIDPYIATKSEVDYPYYGGLFLELKKLCNVKLINEFFDDFLLFKKELFYKLDILIFGLSYFQKFEYYGKINNIDVPSI
jgi:hypothetical protein